MREIQAGHIAISSPIAKEENHTEEQVSRQRQKESGFHFKKGA
jgi:hypothetical protein